MRHQTETFSIMAAVEEEDEILAEYFLRMWHDIGVSQEEIIDTALHDTKTFIRRARLDLDFMGFIARSNGFTVGSVCCQKLTCAYPMVTTNILGKRGYVWGVYVEPGFRQRGVARELVGQCINHLISVGCEEVYLHASHHGRSLYERIGFQTTNEMSIKK
ncbi:MAG: GNAT family N-acetyltransferase [Geminicoccaceae bacterium]